MEHLGVYIPGWLWSWHSLVLGIGLLMGYRKDFKPGGWILWVVIGGLITIQSILKISLAPYAMGLILIGSGLYLLLKPKSSSHKCEFWASKHTTD